jgi:hypothetical protein
MGVGDWHTRPVRRHDNLKSQQASFAITAATPTCGRLLLAEAYHLHMLVGLMCASHKGPSESISRRSRLGEVNCRSLSRLPLPPLARPLTAVLVRSCRCCSQDHSPAHERGGHDTRECGQPLAGEAYRLRRRVQCCHCAVLPDPPHPWACPLRPFPPWPLSPAPPWPWLRCCLLRA